MSCGIYLLQFKGTTKVYIGQSKNIEQRYRQHLQSLVNQSSSKKLNDAYNLYGIPALLILLECAEHELSDNENSAIEIYDSVTNGFNTCHTAEEAPCNIDKYGDLNPFSKYSNEIIYNAATLMLNPKLTLLEISNITGINYATIRKISQGVQHTWIKEADPELWTNLQEVRAIRAENNTSNLGTLLQNKFCAEAKGISYPAIKGPTGTVYNITNFSAFCREHGLQASNLRRVISGERSQHKGFSVLK